MGMPIVTQDKPPRLSANIIIWLLIILVPLICVGTVGAIFILILHWDSSSRLTRGVLYLGLCLSCLVVGKWLFSFPGMGITGQNIWKGLGYAAMVLVVTYAFSLLLQLPVSLIKPEPAVLSPVLFYLAVALGEEIWFRGLIYQAFYNWKGPALAVFGSTVIFGLAHVPLQGWQGLSFAISMGLPFAIIRYKTNNILGLILAHWLIDLIDNFLHLSPTSLNLVWMGILYLVVFGGLSLGLWLSGRRRIFLESK